MFFLRWPKTKQLVAASPSIWGILESRRGKKDKKIELEKYVGPQYAKILGENEQNGRVVLLVSAEMEYIEKYGFTHCISRSTETSVK